MQWKEMTARARGDIIVIDLRGNMCLCGEDELPTFVSDLLEQGFLKFILNLRELPSIDSGGLSGIVRAYTAVTRRGGRLGLLHVQPRIRGLLEITKLTSFFEAFDSEDEALQTFGGSLPSMS